MSKTRLTMLLCFLLLGACLAEPVGRPFISPIIPNQVPSMLDNQWRLTELIYNGTPRDFDIIQPVLLTFQDGLFSFEDCGSISYFSDTTDFKSANEYRLLGSVGLGKDCKKGGVEQGKILARALYATNRYEIVSDRLILSGEQARLTFVLDNEATKPPGW